MKYNIILSLAVTLALFSCSKDNNGNNDNCSPSLQSIPGTYKLTSVMYISAPGAEAEDYLNGPDACLRDHEYDFDETGTYSLNDVGVQCTPPVTAAGTWSLTNNTEFTLDRRIGQINDFTCDGFIFVETNVYQQGDVQRTGFTRQ
jgi:hypothetical protein